MQQIEPWMIASWPIIERIAAPDQDIASSLRHLGTTVAPDRDDFGRRLGRTVYGGDDSGIGIAWDWVEAASGVFALSDPMGIVSNIGFVDPDGDGLSDIVAAVQLNRIAHALAWQNEVANVAATTSAAAAFPGSANDALHGQSVPRHSVVSTAPEERRAA